MRARKILLVDDASEFRTSVRNALAPAFSIVEADSIDAFRRAFRPYTFDLVILDMRLDSEREGLVLLREMLAHDELQPVIIVSAYGDTDAILDAAEGGALMFLRKEEFTPELLARMVEAVLQQARIRRHLASLQNRVRVEDPLGLTTGNPLARRAARLIEQAAADSGGVVVVSGEPGAGHDLAAAAVHARSGRRSAGPFVIACGGQSQPGDMRASLFGSAGGKGVARRKGALEEGNRGIVFLDRFDALNLELQGDLLRAVAKRQIESDLTVPLDVQFIVGVAPETAPVAAGIVRQNWPAARVIEVALPALRERREDVPLLAAYFLQELRREGRTSAQAFSKEALQAMEGWDWPGNLHELRAVVGYGGVQALVAGSDQIERRHLPRNMTDAVFSGSNGQVRTNVRAFLAQSEASLVAETIAKHQGTNKKQLAEMLGYTDRFAFTRRMRKLLSDYPDVGREFPKVEALFR